MKADAEAVVGAFVDAFNVENLDAMVAALAESVAIHGRRGVVRGRDAAREWATRKPSGDLSQRLVLDEVLNEGDPPVALIRRQWLWAGGDEVADEQQLGVLVALDDDGLIALWRPFEDRDEALDAAGLGSAAPSDHGSP